MRWSILVLSEKTIFFHFTLIALWSAFSIEFNRKPLYDVKVHSVIHIWVSEFEWILQMRINYNSSFVIQVSLLESGTTHYVCDIKTHAYIHTREQFSSLDSW